MSEKIEISPKTILLTLAVLILLLALYLIRDLIIIIFVSFILFVALSPLVEKLVRRNFPRPLAVFLVVLAIFLVFALLVAAFLIPFLNEFNSLVERLTEVIGGLRPLEFVDRAALESNLRNSAGTVINFVFSLLNNILAVISAFIFTIYFLLARDRYERLIEYLAKKGYRSAALFEKIEKRLGAWVRAQFLISLTIGILYFIALVILGIDFALPLSIIGGLLEIIPIFGPILAWVPAAIIALTKSPPTVLFVTIAYLIIQQIEGNVVVPLLFGRVIGVDPLLVLVAIAIGGRLLGFGGVLLAVPVTVVVQIVLEDYLTQGKGGFPFWLRS
jgi:predicted PurR-regulated permease PerM